MKRSIKITIGTILFILILTTSFLIFKYEAGETTNSKICCNNKCFNIEIADNKESRELGLMNRGSLPDDSGMLFVFEKLGIYPFRMKNTLIPLAGIRLDSDLKIVDIIQMDPCTSPDCQIYTPKSEALYVLEINQGLISEKGLLKIGDFCNLTKK